VKEQSHKDEMRAAVKADFGRLRARRETGGEEPLGSPPQSEGQAGSVVAVPDSPQPSWLGRLRDRL
jgi:hypothetical protein